MKDCTQLPVDDADTDGQQTKNVLTVNSLITWLVHSLVFEEKEKRYLQSVNKKLI